MRGGGAQLPDLIAHYEFNGDLNDSVEGNGALTAHQHDSDGTTVDPSYDDGNTAVNLNGDYHLNLPDETTSKIVASAADSGITIVANVKKIMVRNQFLFTMSQGYHSGENNSFGVIDGQYLSNNHAFRYESNGDIVVADDSSRDLADTDYTQLAIVYSEGEKTSVKLYVNGTLKGSGDDLGKKISDVTKAADGKLYGYIGGSPWPDPDYNAFIDDFAVYDEALTDEQVKNLLPEKSITVRTQENCEVQVSEKVKRGEPVTITITANEGYEVAKLNINDVTVAPTAKDGNTATYTIESVTGDTTVDAWADPVGRLEMSEMSAEAFAQIAPDITVYKQLPSGYSDGDVVAQYDYAQYPHFAVYDAGENGKYNLTRVITYARPDMPGRAHIKIYGADSLSAEMFNNDVGANTGKLTSLTHDNNDQFFGTGSWADNRNTKGSDSVRGEYIVNENPGYRYIVIASDHQNMLSLTELKIYGSSINTHDSDYFGFEPVSADEMNKFNKIAIKVNDDEIYTAPFKTETVFTGAGEVTVGKYAIQITDLPDGKNVTDMKLYVE